MPTHVYGAKLAGKAAQDPSGIWWVAYSGDCLSPLRVKASNTGLEVPHTTAVYLTRCRRCIHCLWAKRRYWISCMDRQIKEANRTWFGTLTLSPAWQEVILHRAQMASDDASIPWDDANCDARFAAQRAELVKECQKFWKRLRKAGHKFKYVLVFERHKSGLPHMHWLLHEIGEPITKRAIQNEWSLGHSNVSIVGGKSRNAANPRDVAHYVAKYLTKSRQSRVIASLKYKSSPSGHSSK